MIDVEPLDTDRDYHYDSYEEDEDEESPNHNDEDEGYASTASVETEDEEDDGAGSGDYSDYLGLPPLAVTSVADDGEGGDAHSLFPHDSPTHHASSSSAAAAAVGGVITSLTSAQDVTELYLTGLMALQRALRPFVAQATTGDAASAATAGDDGVDVASEPLAHLLRSELARHRLFYRPASVMTRALDYGAWDAAAAVASAGGAPLGSTQLRLHGLGLQLIGSLSSTPSTSSSSGVAAPTSDAEAAAIAKRAISVTSAAMTSAGAARITTEGTAASDAAGTALKSPSQGALPSPRLDRLSFSSSTSSLSSLSSTASAAAAVVAASPAQVAHLRLLLAWWATNWHALPLTSLAAFAGGGDGLPSDLPTAFTASGVVCGDSGPIQPLAAVLGCSQAAADVVLAVALYQQVGPSSASATSSSAGDGGASRPGSPTLAAPQALLAAAPALIHHQPGSSSNSSSNYHAQHPQAHRGSFAASGATPSTPSRPGAAAAGDASTAIAAPSPRIASGTAIVPAASSSALMTSETVDNVDVSALLAAVTSEGPLRLTAAEESLALRSFALLLQASAPLLALRLTLAYAKHCHAAQGLAMRSKGLPGVMSPLSSLLGAAVTGASNAESSAAGARLTSAAAAALSSSTGIGAPDAAIAPVPFPRLDDLPLTDGHQPASSSAAADGGGDDDDVSIVPLVRITAEAAATGAASGGVLPPLEAARWYESQGDALSVAALGHVVSGAGSGGASAVAGPGDGATASGAAEAAAAAGVKGGKKGKKGGAAAASKDGGLYISSNSSSSSSAKSGAASGKEGDSGASGGPTGPVVSFACGHSMTSAELTSRWLPAVKARLAGGVDVDILTSPEALLAETQAQHPSAGSSSAVAATAGGAGSSGGARSDPIATLLLLRAYQDAAAEAVAKQAAASSTGRKVGGSSAASSSSSSLSVVSPAPCACPTCAMASYSVAKV